MTQPINVLSNRKELLEKIYLSSISSLIREVYYYPHILLVAESGAGKSTLISRLSSKKMRKILKLEIGKIRSTACTAKHLFDPNLNDNIFGVSVTQKVFGKIRDDITVIITSVLAAKLVEYSKNKDEVELKQIMEEAYNLIFVINKSLFNFSEICNDLKNEIAINVIKEELLKIFEYMISEEYIAKARSNQEKNAKNKTKKMTLKSFVEEVIISNLDIDARSKFVEYFDNIFKTIEITINKKVENTFKGRNQNYLYSIFNVDVDEVEATDFMKKLFGTSNDSINNRNKGIQYFLEDVWIHVPTNKACKEEKPFVIIDTEGLTHQGENDEEIRNKFFRLVNCNRINHVIFMKPFSTDLKIFNIVRDSLTRLKKNWEVSIVLPKYDEFVVSELVASGEDLEEQDDMQQLFEEVIQPAAEQAIEGIEQSIKIHNATTKYVKFEDKVKKVSFGFNSQVKQTTPTELYEFLGGILRKIEQQNITIPVRLKNRVDIDKETKGTINFNIDITNLKQVCNRIIKNNSLIKSIPTLIKKHPYWTSVYTLKDKISYGNGHTTNAEVYDNFSVYPAKTIENDLRKVQLVNFIEWNFDNLVEIPSELEKQLVNAINKELQENIYRRIALDLTYKNIMNNYYNNMYYLTWYRWLLKTYNKNLTNLDYWVSEIELQMNELIKFKIGEVVDFQYSN